MVALSKVVPGIIAMVVVVAGVQVVIVVLNK